MFFFSFGPWAILLSAAIFEFRPKIFLDFSHLFEGPGGKRAQVTFFDQSLFVLG